MRAVVLYESMYGNTRAVAEEIGRGLVGFDVTVLSVGGASAADTSGADLVVVGAPTHAFGMSRPQTRAAAAEAVQKAVGALLLEPGALGPGVREWLAVQPRSNQLVAVFDTRIKGAGLAGHAAPRIAKALQRLGRVLVDEPHSFFVTKQNVLRKGELDGAHAWAQVISAKLQSGHLVGP
jgi:flavodoxin-like protein